MILNTTELERVIKHAADIVTSPEQDQALAELMLAQMTINNTVSEVKKLIEAKALEYNPNFKGIKSDNVVISYRTGGTKYKPADGVDPSTLPAQYIKASTRYFLQSGAIEDYHDKHGKFPKGVELAERSKSIVIDLVSDGKEKV